MRLLSNSKTNAKTVKMLDEFGYEAVIHYMAPDKVADGYHTICPHSTPGCRESCLYTAGRGAMRMVQTSRINKTLDWLGNRDGYCEKLIKELALLETRALSKGYRPVARLNGTSDVPWERYLPMYALPNIQFYDYTKDFVRMQRYMQDDLPENYHLTYSYSERDSFAEVRFIIAGGHNVAVVFRNKLPKKFYEIKVISGMEHDFRFRDQTGRIVGLLARGRAKHDDTGFVVGV
jgi:hypothetical protein